MSEAEIDEQTADLGLRLPFEARVWWGWHDGADSAGGAEDTVIGRAGPRFLTVREAVELYERQRRIAADSAEHPQAKEPLTNPAYWWSPTWFPITETGYGGVIACDCAVTGQQPTPIRMVKWGGAEHWHTPVAGSFGVMVRWWIEAFDVGAWRYDPGRRRWEYDSALIERSRELTGLV